MSPQKRGDEMPNLEGIEHDAQERSHRKEKNVPDCTRDFIPFDQRKTSKFASRIAFVVSIDSRA
jgi:hypothetical protein